MKKYWKETAVLLIAMVLVSSSIAIADVKNSETQKSSVINPITRDDVINQQVRNNESHLVWDNGMDYDSLVEAQEPFSIGHIDAYPADDFQFDINLEVTGVYWIGGYSNKEPEPWDWCIDIYSDDGTNNTPGDKIFGPFCYTWEDINKEEVEPGIWEMWVDLPYSIELEPIKCWISIYAVGDDPPSAGWGYHLDIYKLHQAIFKSIYFGYPNWVEISKVVGYPSDMCYQLIANCNQTIDVEKQVMDKEGEWQDCDTENEALDVVISNNITFKIVIPNDEDYPLYDIDAYDVMLNGLKYISADPEPDEYYYEEPFWYINWHFPGPLMPNETIEIYVTAHVEGPECSINYNYVKTIGKCRHVFNVTDDDYCYVHAIKKDKTIYTPFLNWLQSHPKLFPLLKLLLQRLKI